VITKVDILIDAREFVPDRMTGIGRMLMGLVDALADSPWVKTIILAEDHEAVPVQLQGWRSVSSVQLPKSFIQAEWALSQLTRKGYGVFISPYPKLPLFGVHCPSVQTIHDILDLSVPVHRKKYKALIDKMRLARALRQADMTWYDSHWSMQQTEDMFGFRGKDPRVRHLGIDHRFNDAEQPTDKMVLEKYGLSKGYLLTVGNGLRHKNLGILLEIAGQNSRLPVFAGVSASKREYWEHRNPAARAVWIETVKDEDLPALLRQAFCLSQPSLTEGYGYPPLEAMACGTPAVVSDIPVLTETTGLNALVADPLDGKSWLAAYERLENENLYQTQVEKGLCWVARIKGRQGWMKHVADIEDLVGSRPNKAWPRR